MNIDTTLSVATCPSVTPEEVAAMDEIRREFRHQKHEGLALLGYVRIMAKLAKIEAALDHVCGENR